MRLREILKTVNDKTAGDLNKWVKNYCAEQLGYGAYRDVYAMRDNPNYVVKIERNMANCTFANATEWRHWIDNMHWHQFAKWLAPVAVINVSGSVSIQRRVTFYGPEWYPTKIPSLFTDTKYGNFGWIGNQFVCCDYSFLVQEQFKMRTVKWKK